MRYYGRIYFLQCNSAVFNEDCFAVITPTEGFRSSCDAVVTAGTGRWHSGNVSSLNVKVWHTWMVKSCVFLLEVRAARHVAAQQKRECLLN